jgi:hypothetical protein
MLLTIAGKVVAWKVVERLSTIVGKVVDYSRKGCFQKHYV